MKGYKKRQISRTIDQRLLATAFALAILIWGTPPLTLASIYEDNGADVKDSQPHQLSNQIWRDFAEWIASLPENPNGPGPGLRDRYIAHLQTGGLSLTQAQKRLEWIDRLRAESPELEQVYWDGKHKLGDSPTEPLPLLREAMLGLAPGKALDMAMGNGRNGVYLASLGWDVTGYDISAEAIRAANAIAAKAKVKIKAVQASHDTFDFGLERWDLIVMSYAYIDTLDGRWPEKLWRSLKPKGTVVFQGNTKNGPPKAEIASLWRLFQLKRFEDIHHGEDWFAGQPTRTIKIIALKKAD